MKYFIRYLIEGEAREYQKELINRICEKFDVVNLNKLIPAHFTLKAPFEADDIVAVEDLLGKLFLKEKKSRADINGIGNFDERVIYLNGNLSSEALQTFRKLNEELRKISWMKFGEYDLVEDSFHATLTRARDDSEFDDVMKFLDDERPCFELSFDNVCIFQRLKDKWVVYKKFNLG